MAWPNLFKAVMSDDFDRKLCDKYLKDLYKTTKHHTSVLHFAIIGGNIETIQYLIDNNADLNARNIYGETPLHWCCKEGTIEVAKLLIHHGANYTRADFDGNTPLHWAVEYNQHEIVSYLLSKGVSCNEANTDLQTPMEIAVLNSSAECVTILNSYITKSLSPRNGKILPVQS